MEEWSLVKSHPFFQQFQQDFSKLTFTNRNENSLQFMLLYMKLLELETLSQTYVTKCDYKDYHYKNCCWSNPKCEEDPDTCKCYNISCLCYYIITKLDEIYKCNYIKVYLSKTVNNFSNT